MNPWNQRRSHSTKEILQATENSETLQKWGVQQLLIENFC